MFEQAMHPIDSLFYEYLDEELDSTERISMETHLAVCPICQARLAEFRGFYQQIADLPDRSPSRNLVPLVLEAISGRIQTPRQRRILAFTTTVQMVLVGAALLWLIPSATWQSLGQSLGLDLAEKPYMDRVAQTLIGWFGAWETAWSNGLAAWTGGLDSLRRVVFLPRLSILELGLIGLLVTLAWLLGNSLLIASLHLKSKQRNS